MYKLLVMFTVLLALQATGLYLTSDPTSLRFAIPLNHEQSTYKQNFALYLSDHSTFAWDSYKLGDCQGVTLSPASDRDVELSKITVTIDWTFNFTQANIQPRQCVIKVTARQLTSSTSITANVIVYSDRCSDYPNPAEFCPLNSYCDTSTGKCLCDDFYLPASNCTVYCDPAVTCSGHGKCHDRWELCTCDEHYLSKNCSIFCSREQSCSNAGSCKSDGSCACDKGYLGDKCQFKMCPICGVHGTYNETRGVCECHENYYGPTCDVYCDVVTCGQNGQCGTNGQCKCDDGYYGSACDIECSPTSCLNGYCSREGRCVCDHGYYGANCDKTHVTSPTAANVPVSSGSTPNANSQTSPQEQKSENSVSTVALVGLAVGSFVGGAVVVALIVIVINLRKNRDRDQGYQLVAN